MGILYNLKLQQLVARDHFPFLFTLAVLCKPKILKQKFHLKYSVKIPLPADNGSKMTYDLWEQRSLEIPKSKAIRPEEYQNTKVQSLKRKFSRHLTEISCSSLEIDRSISLLRSIALLKSFGSLDDQDNHSRKMK